MKIIIQEEPKSASEAIKLLEQISISISNGYTRGFYPHWHLEMDMEESYQVNNEMNEWLPL
jgi:hypothetical protein